MHYALIKKKKRTLLMETNSRDVELQIRMQCLNKFIFYGIYNSSFDWVALSCSALGILIHLSCQVVPGFS